MQLRRWHTVLAMASLLSAGAAGVGAPPTPKPAEVVATLPGAPSPIKWTATDDEINSYVKAQAKRLAAATGEDALHVRTEILSIPLPSETQTGNPSATFMQSYTNAVVNNLTPLLNDSHTATALTAIITLAQLHHINTDSALEVGLQNASPAVRYWAARGLYDILPDLRPVGSAFDRAVSSLADALKTETAPLVKAEMVRSLGHSGDAKAVDPIIAALSQIAANAKAKMPDEAALLTASTSLSGAAELAGITPSVIAKPQQTPLVQAAAGILYFSASQLVATFGDDDKPGVQGAKLALIDVANNGATLFNKLAGKDIANFGGLNRSSKPSEILVAIQKLTGGQVDDGTLITVFDGVVPPAKVK